MSNVSFEAICEGYKYHPAFPGDPKGFHEYWSDVCTARDQYRSGNEILKSIRTMTKHRRKIWDKTNGLCFYCGIKLRPFKVSPLSQGANFIVEHYVPKLKGGRGTYSNLYPSCAPCNVSKGSLSISAWRQDCAVKSNDDIFFWAEENGWKMLDGRAFKISGGQK